MIYPNDELFMQRALDLALKGQYTARPNPMVGAVLVKNGEVLAEGFHTQAGQAHAEIEVLKQVGEHAEGATLYVTLEPCAHEGKTPPCVDALIAHKLQRVVIAVEDPNSLVAGKSILALETAGIEVTVGVLKNKATALNMGFFQRMTKQRPFVRFKVAMSLDAKVAMSTGESQWITSPEARCNGHLWRARSGAILTTKTTVEKDNCLLTVRHPNLEALLPQETTFCPPFRFIMDTQLITSPQSRIFKSGEVVVGIGPHLDHAKQAAFLSQLPENHQVQLVAFELDHNQRVSFSHILAYLAEREVNDLLIEAGPHLLTHALEQYEVDELLVYISPDLMGEDTLPMQFLNFNQLAHKIKGEYYQVNKVGRDIEARILIKDEPKSIY